MLKLKLTSCFCLFVTLATLVVPPQLNANQSVNLIFLVRHAEKTDDSRDPPLSDAGRLRSSELAHMLKDTGIDQIYSTDFARTRTTAEPLASLLQLNVQIYDPQHLQSFADKLREINGRILVVGHSNTTPQLVKLLGGDGGSEIDEHGEYDRLYVLSVVPGGEVQTVLLRYGERFSP